jgi:hypothetical protein
MHVLDWWSALLGDSGAKRGDGRTSRVCVIVAGK